MSQITAARLASYQAKLRRTGKSETTIHGHTAQLRAMLRWAHDLGYIAAVPKIPRVPRSKAGSKVMKGRPLTPREVVRMLRATSNVVGPERSKDWRRFIKGLYFSGLRLEEAIALSWDDPTVLMVDLSGRRPMFRVHAEQEQEKGFQDRILPMAPEFYEFLMRTPEAERTGPVFRFPWRREWGRGTRKDSVSRVLSDIGRAAGVVVDARSGKFASAHDLRRSFGDRWALRITPLALQQLMRHEDITTTQRYYAGKNAAAVSDELWKARTGNTAGITCPHCGKRIDVKHVHK